MGNLHISDHLLGGDVHVLRVAGEVDFDVAPQFKRHISTLIDGGARQVIADLSAVSFIDSTAIGVLVGAIKRLRSVGGALAVVCDNEDVRGIFELVGLESVIPLHRCEADACAALAIAA